MESDIDVSTYQLLLVKFSVGCQKFTVANGLSNSKIKNRITMMNVEKTVCWKWKYVLSIPALLVVFALVSFSRSTSETSYSPIATVGLSDSTTIDYVLVPASAFNTIGRNDGVKVYMNKNSQLLIDNEPSALSEMQQTVYNNFIKKTSSKLDLNEAGLLKEGSQKTRIYIRKDVSTNDADYNELVENLCVCISKLQDYYSDKVFSKSFNVLTADEQSQISHLIEPRLYGMEPKGMERLSKMIIVIELIENDKVLLNDELVSIEDISDRIVALKASDVIGTDYEYIVQIKAFDDTKMEIITSIKQELREANMLRINLSYKSN